MDPDKTIIPRDFTVTRLSSPQRPQRCLSPSSYPTRPSSSRASSAYSDTHTPLSPDHSFSRATNSTNPNSERPSTNLDHSFGRRIFMIGLTSERWTSMRFDTLLFTDNDVQSVETIAARLAKVGVIGCGVLNKFIQERRREEGRNYVIGWVSVQIVGEGQNHSPMSAPRGLKRIKQEQHGWDDVAPAIKPYRTVYSFQLMTWDPEDWSEDGPDSVVSSSWQISKSSTMDLEKGYGTQIIDGLAKIGPYGRARLDKFLKEKIRETGRAQVIRYLQVYQESQHGKGMVRNFFVELEEEGS
ncbi:hypothetical protein BJ508DRAFT_347401 [Ascobolus immersus RN42]|uniref:Uncharacterized protein n=1 Tax=Ascobolus immersus RN42 TaxID=1160509 RepID=A0A3N4I3Q3_ASCIM|nr:hypothetical protein BJ508DRAFT_347401 [Ascobolus immersus RN42]